LLPDAQIPNLDLAQLLFLAKNGHDKKKEILALVQNDGNKGN
jgi:hypothetical protein